jgi:hypothetical protein
VAQFIQVLGALAILLGFALAQAGRLDVRSTPYLTLNAVGAAVLAVLAYHERQWGFLLLEGVWTLVSLWGFYARRRSTPMAPVH